MYKNEKKKQGIQRMVLFILELFANVKRFGFTLEITRAFNM